MGVQCVRVDVNLVLLDVASDGSYLGDAFDAREGVAHVPILGGAKFVQVPAAGDVAVLVVALKRVPEHLSERCGIGPECRLNSGRKRTGWEAVELLERLQGAPP